MRYSTRFFGNTSGAILTGSLEHRTRNATERATDKSPNERCIALTDRLRRPQGDRDRPAEDALQRGTLNGHQASTTATDATWF